MRQIDWNVTVCLFEMVVEEVVLVATSTNSTGFDVMFGGCKDDLIFERKEYPQIKVVIKANCIR